MGRDEFDDFDFGGSDSDGFGGDSDGFGDGFGGDGDDFNFDIDTGSSSSDAFGGLDDNTSSSGADAFDLATNNNEFPEAPETTGALTKKSILFIVIGVIGVILVIVLATSLTRFANKKNSSIEQMQEQEVEQSTVKKQDKNVDNLMQSPDTKSTQSNSNSTVVTNTKDSNFIWTDITDGENVSFNSDYVDMVFTVTQIQHKARAVDTNGNLVVKSTILGSISGLSGTYELDIPYNKGTKLVVGNSFTVHVQLGTFNDKTVVGEIRY